MPQQGDAQPETTRPESNANDKPPATLDTGQGAPGEVGVFDDVPVGHPSHGKTRRVKQVGNSRMCQAYHTTDTGERIWLNTTTSVVGGSVEHANRIWRVCLCMLGAFSKDEVKAIRDEQYFIVQLG